ncbi:MAG: exosortase U [Planctomycetota bacterium]
MAPLLYQYLTWSWRDGHYQYFPLLLVVIVGMIWSRREEAIAAATTASSALIVVGLAIALAGCLIGHLLDSGFVGIVVAAWATIVFLYAYVGWGGVWAMLPVLALIMLAIPLPLGLDGALIFQMQYAASVLADLILDGAGIRHVREGVLLITENARYMTEEACSGVRSLFSSLAVVSVFSVIDRHHLIRVGFNLAQTIFWVLIGNAIRVALCVVLADHVSTWFASGTGHELLSLVIFAFILLMVANTDAALRIALQERVSWYDDVETRAAFESPDTTQQPTRAQQTRPVAVAVPNQRIWTVAFLSLAVFGFLAFRVADSANAMRITSDQRLPPLTQEDLPPVIIAAGDSADGGGSWRQIEFERVDRDVDAMLAETSFTWTYASDDLSAVVSVDCPWSSWHNLDVCYRAIGWSTQPTYFRPSPPTVAWSDLSVTDIKMERSNGNATGRVLFTVIDRDRDEVLSASQWRNRLGSIDSLFKILARRIRLILTGDGGGKSIALPATTIQVMCDHAGELTEAEHAAVEALFYESRRLLLEGRRWQSETSS